MVIGGEQQAIAVTELSQIGEVRRAAVRLAEAIGLTEGRRGDAAIIASELATNLVRYGRRGHVLVQPLHSAAGQGLELLAIDAGPGMADLQRCLRDGYSTGGGAGTGLGAIRRLSDEFDIYSNAGAGTVAVSRLYGAGWNGTAARFVLGAISVAAPGESVCGDVWAAAQREGELAVMVADGLGHGPAAAEASHRARRVFAENPFLDFVPFFERTHAALAGSRGAAVARAHVTGPTGLSYASVGNISGSLLGPAESRGLPFQNGTLGVHSFRKLDYATYAWPDRGLLVLHSDGLTTRWNMARYPGLQSRHPAVVAGVLYRDHLRGRDDATVVVARPSEATLPC